MSGGQDIDRFVKDPSLLVELCREVIDELGASNDDSDVGEREAQLREIVKTSSSLCTSFHSMGRMDTGFRACLETQHPCAFPGIPKIKKPPGPGAPGGNPRWSGDYEWNLVSAGCRGTDTGL